jgi:hypothetical protein
MVNVTMPGFIFGGNGNSGGYFCPDRETGLKR